jgi:hypothetical protein
MYLPKTNSQAVLPFCDGCPFAFTKRCKGPENLKSFVKNDESVHGCIEPSQREKAFSDTYDRTPVPYLTSHQRTIKLPTFIPEVKTGLNPESAIEKSGQRCSIIPNA